MLDRLRVFEQESPLPAPGANLSFCHPTLETVDLSRQSPVYASDRLGYDPRPDQTCLSRTDAVSREPPLGEGASPRTWEAELMAKTMKSYKGVPSDMGVPWV